MSKFRSLVKNAFDKYPIVTNSVIYGSLCVSAELSQQVLTKKVLAEQPIPLDGGAVGRFALYGTTVQGPILAVWYRWLDRKYVGTATKIVAKKMLIDQFLMTPCLYVLFFISMSALERKQDVFEECRLKFVQTFKTSCLFWLPAQGVNFFLVPPALRVTYVGLCSFAWVNILCYIKNQKYE